jgi:adenosylcobinamide-phosphate synthase
MVLAIAAFLDFLIGDPWNWPHPVQIMGWGIQQYTQWVLKRINHPLGQRIAGVVLAVLMVGLSAGVGWGLVYGARFVNAWFSLAIESILLASCFAGRSLRRSAEEVLKPLHQGDVAAARSRLQRYVGRDTEELSPSEILRAVLETVTENATDGVMAPLFWAIVGTFTPIGPVPFALGYKAASTLDSMVGYREEPYTYLGWFSARLEDVLTWLPCRFVVFSLCALANNPGYVWRVCCRDAPKDPSPNAGWSECVYAAILDVQVGGTNRYRGIEKQKPLLGNPNRSINAEAIRQALKLTRLNFLIWLAIGLVYKIFL